jgi:hypothetical protein
MQVPADMSIAYIPCTSAGSYPGLYLATTPSHFVQNVKQMFGDGSVELIGPLEQVHVLISCFILGILDVVVVSSNSCCKVMGISLAIIEACVSHFESESSTFD